MTDDEGTFAEREAIRLPLWCSIAGAAVFQAVIMTLSGVGWRATVITVLGALGPTLFGAEIARQNAWSPASVWKATVAARNDEAGKDAGRSDLVGLGIFLVLVALAAAIFVRSGF